MVTNKSSNDTSFADVQYKGVIGDFLGKAMEII
jgi:hypothetical protein